MFVRGRASPWYASTSKGCTRSREGGRLSVIGFTPRDAHGRGGGGVVVP